MENKFNIGEKVMVKGLLGRTGVIMSICYRPENIREKMVYRIKLKNGTELFPEDRLTKIDQPENHEDERFMRFTVEPIFSSTPDFMGDNIYAVRSKLVSLNDFDFELGDEVKIDASGETGKIIGRSEFTNAEPQYLIRYKCADGRAVESWWSEESLTKVEG
jgi:hypothetical protein